MTHPKDWSHPEDCIWSYTSYRRLRTMTVDIAWCRRLTGAPEKIRILHPTNHDEAFASPNLPVIQLCKFLPAMQIYRADFRLWLTRQDIDWQPHESILLELGFKPRNIALGYGTPYALAKDTCLEHAIVWLDDYHYQLDDDY